MIIFGACLTFFGLAWFFIIAGLAPPMYEVYEAGFGIVIALIGFIAATYAMLFGQSIIHVRF